MNKLLIHLLTLLVLMSFKWQTDQEKTVYSDFKFKTYQEQADSLVSFMNQAQQSKSTLKENFEKKFFNAFPSSFKEMQAIFGYDSKKGASPLYTSNSQSEKYLNKRIFSDVIGFFSELESIPDSIYYEKYININIDGYWQADNIREAFGFHYRLLNDIENISPVLSQYSDKEIKSVFRFIFDGPHPANDTNKNKYDQLFPKIESMDKRMGKLLNESYSQLLKTDGAHGH